VAAYYFWRNEFLKAWVDVPSELPEGVNLANDDWRIGVLMVVALFAIAAIKTLQRSS